MQMSNTCLGRSLKKKKKKTGPSETQMPAHSSTSSHFLPFVFVLVEVFQLLEEGGDFSQQCVEIMSNSSCNRPAVLLKEQEWTDWTSDLGSYLTPGWPEAKGQSCSQTDKSTCFNGFMVKIRATLGFYSFVVVYFTCWCQNKMWRRGVGRRLTSLRDPAAHHSLYLTFNWTLI